MSLPRSGQIHEAYKDAVLTAAGLCNTPGKEVSDDKLRASYDKLSDPKKLSVLEHVKKYLSDQNLDPLTDDERGQYGLMSTKDESLAKAYIQSQRETSGGTTIPSCVQPSGQGPGMMR